MAKEATQLKPSVTAVGAFIRIMDEDFMGKTKVIIRGQSRKGPGSNYAARCTTCARVQETNYECVFEDVWQKILHERAS